MITLTMLLCHGAVTTLHVTMSMRFGFLLAALVIASCSTVAVGVVSDNTSASIPPITTSFVQTSGHQFVLDGKPLYINGANMYWLMITAANPERKSEVSKVLRDAARVGVSVVRTWAFADGFGKYYLQKKPGVYDAKVFEVRKRLTCIL